MTEAAANESILSRIVKLVGIIWGIRKVQSIDESLKSLRVNAKQQKKQLRDKPFRPIEYLAAEKAELPHTPVLSIFLMIFMAFVFRTLAIWWSWFRIFEFMAYAIIALDAIRFVYGLVRLVFEQSKNNFDVILNTLKSEHSGEDTFFDLGFYHRKDHEEENDRWEEIEEVLHKGIKDEERIAFWCGHAYYHGQSDEIAGNPIGFAKKWYGHNEHVLNWYLRGRRAAYA